MPVTVQIPDTSAFAETTVSDFSDVTGLIAPAGKDYLCACGGLGLGKFLQISKDLATHTTLTFAGDGKHTVPIDLCYAPTQNRVYVLFYNDGGGQLTVGVVNPDTPAVLADFKNIDLSGDFTGALSLTTDDTYLYIVSELDTPSQLLKYQLSNGNFIAGGPIVGFNLANGIRYANNKLFVHGNQAPSSVWVARLTTALAIEQSTTFESGAGAGATHDFSVAGSYVWLGARDTTGIVKRLLQSDLTNATDVATNQTSKSTEVEYDGTNVWSLFENGRGARINPSSAAVSVYTVNDGQDYQREIAGDGTFIWTAT